MELDFIVKLILIGLIHWVLAGIALKSLVERRRVIGGRKGLWALPILFISSFGPLLYLMAHEVYPDLQDQVDYRGQGYS